MLPVKKMLPVLLLPVSAILLTVSPLGADEGPCQSLTMMYCTKCHKAERICESVGEKDEAAWKKTLATMGEYGDIDQGTLDQVLDCVNKKEKGESAVCKK